MEFKDIVTNIGNVSVGCCIGLTASFGTQYTPSVESKYYFEDNNKAGYVSNESQAKKEPSRIVNMVDLESSALLERINDAFSLNIDGHFLPNSDSQEKITLFITCEKFRDYCENEKYDKAFELELEITSKLEDELANNHRIGRVAFL